MAPNDTHMQKSRAQIITVHPPDRKIEGKLPDGGTIRIALFEVPIAFRWPIVGEVWSVYRENLYWMLGSRINDDTTEVNPISGLSSQMRLDAPRVTNSAGHTLLALPSPLPALTYSRATETAAITQLRLALTALGLVLDHTVA